MRRHLKTWLNDDRLVALGGVYEGAVADVIEETVRNKIRATRELVPVIVFDDGWRLIPNVTMRAALVDALGADTDAWRGRRLRVERRRIEYLSGKSAWMKAATVVDLARPILSPAPAPSPSMPTGRLPRSEPIERSDYDDSDAALAEAGQTPVRRTSSQVAVMKADEIPWGSR